MDIESGVMMIALVFVLFVVALLIMIFVDNMQWLA
jgi:hypothetical protein